MQERLPTLKELAARLNLSVATVSRALAGHEQIALGTRQRVAEAAERYGYVPNKAARALVSGRSDFIGLVIPVRGPSFMDYFLGEFVTGLGAGLVAHGSDLLIATAAEGQTVLSVLQHVVESGRADGVVVTRIAERDERLAYLRRMNFPFVAHGRLLDEQTPHNWLDTDGEHAFAQAFEMLYALGHRQFGLVTIAERMTFRRHRENGLTRAIARKGDPSVRLTIDSSPRFDVPGRIAAVNRLLHAPQRPTAILGLFDEIALTVIEQATAMGLSIPRDLSVVGFDNATAAAYAPPGLTTFDGEIRRCAQEIAGMLMQVIHETPEEPLNKLLLPPLIERGSHGPAPDVKRG